MKLLLISIILFCASVATAQDTNVHVGGLITGTNNLGISKTYGASAGTDYRIHKTVISVDGDIFHLCKIIYGCGAQENIRGTVSYYVKPTIALEGGVQGSRYSVTHAAKSSFQVIAGARFAAVNEKVITEFDFRGDATSPNKQKILEARITGYATHKFFLRFIPAVSRYKNLGKYYTGASFTGVLGVHF